VDTCPGDINTWGACSDELTRELKQKYNVP
jgi:hypothetical protein